MALIYSQVVAVVCFVFSEEAMKEMNACSINVET